MKNIRILGVPSCAGALYKGTEKAPDMLRRANLVEVLEEIGFEVEDYGDIDGYREIYRHNIGPVRNWPEPRRVWEAAAEETSKLFDSDSFVLILGGDCSIEVGTFTGFRKVFGNSSHLLALDGHLDTIQPQGESCIGAAGMGLWFLTEGSSTWWNSEAASSENISVIGVQDVPKDCNGIKVVSLSELREGDIGSIIQSHLSSIPMDASILLHLDVDIIHEVVMPAAYSPSKKGLNYETAAEILRLILSDKRVKGLEITEFVPEKDETNTGIEVILNLICQMRSKLL